MTPGELALVALQLVLTVAVGWSLAELVVGRFFPDVDFWFPERALLAVAGAAAFGVAAMIAHIATGGAVLGGPYVVPLLAAVVIVTAWRKRAPAPIGFAWKPWAAALVLLLGLFVIPMLTAGSGVREGDAPWHMGWTHEVLDGQPLPDGPAPEFARNAYPWGWHGILATTVRLVPGSTPFHAHESLHILLVLSLPLASACLARRIRPRSGWAAAGCAALIGGFGWVTAQGTDFVATPTEARYGADMVVASPNSVYALFPPALPREMGLVLLGCAGMLMLYALRQDRPALWYASGIVTGCAGLVSFPILIPAVMWAIVTAVVARSARVASWLRIVVPAFALFALWAVPLAFWYLTEGGFVDIVPVLGVEWPLLTAVAAWGLLGPLAVAGVVVVARGTSPETKAMLGFGLASLASIALALARREFDWDLQGNQTLLHQGRMWPVAHLLGAAFAGIALTFLFEWIARRTRRGAIAAVASILVLGSFSLLLAVPGLVELIEERDKGFVYAHEDLIEGSFVRSAASQLSPGDIVTAEDNGLAFKLFEFSGASLGEYDDPRLEGNEARIRYRDLAERYIARMQSGGFEPTHVVVEEGAPEEGDVLARGEYGGRSWVLIRLRPR